MSVAIIGPGSVGTAFARRLADVGREVLGFVGRDPARVRRAADATGTRVLGPNDLGAAETILITVGDDDLANCVALLADSLASIGAVCVHTSGCLGTDALAPLVERGAAVAALHPLCPFPDAERGYFAMAGAFATVSATGRALEHTTDLARAVGLNPLPIAADADRATYHAACVLAANGVTAAIDLASGLLTAVMDPEDAKRVAGSLARSAADLSTEHGAAAALSGPAVRGDVSMIRGHLGALRGSAAESAYRSLMDHAVSIAHGRGSIDAATVAALRRLLRDDG